VPLLRLNEHYTSIQGEGPNVGVLTQFVRFSGCNMRCPGWPCDTQHAIVPALWKNDPKLDADHVIDAIRKEYASTGASHICLTGGEPFMQDAIHLRTIFTILHHEEGYTFDIFTNGSFPFPLWTANPGVHLIMDWKLSGSGEGQTELVKRKENLLFLRHKDAIKFVVKSEADFAEAISVAMILQPHCPVYVGRVWNATFSDADLIQMIKDNQVNWRLNIQIHKLIYPNIERGI